MTAIDLIYTNKTKVMLKMIINFLAWAFVIISSLVIIFYWLPLWCGQNLYKGHCWRKPTTMECLKIGYKGFFKGLAIILFIACFVISICILGVN